MPLNLKNLGHTDYGFSCTFSMFWCTSNFILEVVHCEEAHTTSGATHQHDTVWVPTFCAAVLDLFSGSTQLTTLSSHLIVAGVERAIAARHTTPSG